MIQTTNDRALLQFQKLGKKYGLEVDRDDSGGSVMYFRKGWRTIAALRWFRDNAWMKYVVCAGGDATPRWAFSLPQSKSVVSFESGFDVACGDKWAEMFEQVETCLTAGMSALELVTARMGGDDE